MESKYHYSSGLSKVTLDLIFSGPQKVARAGVGGQGINGNTQVPGIYKVNTFYLMKSSVPEYFNSKLTFFLF